MKKINTKKVLNITKRIVLSVLVIALIFVIPTISVKGDNELANIYSVFLGNKSKYQGIIEIWNIDSFESGTVSKTNHLNNMATEYQKKNKGLYIITRNLTENECLNLLAQGITPDLFSCSYGIASEIENYIQEFSNNDGINIKNEYYNAGLVKGKLMGLAWCRGNYVLISTESKLEKAKVEVKEGLKLSDIALSCGYKVTTKKGEKTIYSLTFGSQKYILPQVAFKAYNSKGLQSISDESLDKEVLNQTSYDAYCKFIADGSTILLGTQRDVARMENRVALQKVQDVIYEPVKSYTDLVQFMFVSKIEDSVKREYAEGFAKFLTETSSQQKLAGIGMFPVSVLPENPYKTGVMSFIASEINGIYEVPNVFVSKSEIAKLQKDFISL